MSRVDLIIPTYNGLAYLLPCLRSVLRSTFSDYQLIVFDDGSDRPVGPRVHTTVPDAKVLRVERNAGIVHAFNTAIDASASEYVVLLNDDTEVEPDWLQCLVSAADRNPNAGSIASKLRLASDRQVLHSAGDTYAVWGMPGNRGVWLDDFGQYDESTEVFSACGGAALYRRSALDAVRLSNGDVFDRRLFMYCEDVDLGWRLQMAGFPCVFEPEAVVYHHLSATGGGQLASYYVSRNVWHVLARSVPASIRRRHWKRIAAFQLGRLFRNLRSLREPAARRSVIGSIVGFAHFLRHRNDIHDHDPRQVEQVVRLLVDRAF